MTKENPPITIKVVKRLRRHDLLQLDENEQNASLREHHEALVQLIDGVLDSEQELAEKRQEILYAFASRLHGIEHLLLELNRSTHRLQSQQ